MQRTCAHCSATFVVTDADCAFYDKVSPVFGGKKFPVPPPTRCPSCRAQRRMAFRNERSLYPRPCSQCKRGIISTFCPTAPMPVYCSECWWGDGWDATTYARDFDLSRSFFDQVGDLLRSAPALAMTNFMSENSDYVNYCDRVRNCYLLFASSQTEDCYYGMYVWKSRNCLDCQNTIECEECYELLESEKCYRCLCSQKLVNCSECSFCFDLVGCKNCFQCSGLRKAQYHWRNEPLSREEYEKRLAVFAWTHAAIDQAREQSMALSLGTPRRFANLVQCEGSTGDDLSHCNNVRECFDGFGMEDCAYVTNGPGDIRDSYDFTGITASELCLEGVGIPKAYHLLFVNACHEGCSDVLYSSYCMECEHCCGCVGLRRKQHCILNKQYAKEEYERFVPQIIERMTDDGEWGEFFPSALSPYGYNETVAQLHFPLNMNKAEEEGWRWTEGDYAAPHAEKVVAAAQLPETIEAMPDDILDWAITCEATGKPYRIIKQELEFYRRLRLPVPRLHPDERHRRRMLLRNPRRLWDRACGKCRKVIRTTFASERPEIVYCEQCYLAAVY